MIISHMKTRRLLIIFAFLSFTASVFANYSINRLGKNEGLTCSTVQCMVEDARGFVWLGTSDGLFRFDGSRFCYYNMFKQDDLQGKHDNVTGKRVMALALSEDEKLWIGTEHSIQILDMKTEQMSLYDGNLNDRLTYVTKLYADSHNIMWALSYKGITMIDLESSHASTIEGADGVVATHVIETADGTLWFTALDGNIYRYDRHNKKLKPFRILTDDEKNGNTFLVTATSYYKDNIAIATNNRGIRLFNPNDNSISSLNPFGESDPSLYVHTIVCEDDKRLCIGTENGLYIYELSNGNIVHIGKSFTLPNALSDNAIHSLLVKDNSLWAGTFFGGLNVINEEPDVINHFLPNDNGIICGNIIRSMAFDEHGRMWVGSEDCGLLLFDRNTQTLTKQHLKWNNEEMPENIQGMDIHGNVLVVGSFDKGVFIIDVDKNTITHHLSKVMPNDETAHEIVACVKFVNNDTCLLGTNYGLFSYNINTDGVEAIEGIPYCFIHALKMDSKGRIWIGTLNDGLFCIDGYPQNKVAKMTDFPYHNITCLFESSKHLVYVGTDGNGLYAYDPENNRSELVSLSDNAGNLTIASVEETENGHLWISTTSGLFDYDPQKKEVITCYIHSKLLPNDHFNYSSAADNKGNLYFGTYGGMVVLNPYYMESAKDPLKLLVTSIEGKSFFKGYIQDNFFKTSYDKATFTLFFSCPSNSFSRQIWYRHKIEELDNDWTVKSSPSPIEFQNLPPGTYHVCLQASYFNGVWDNPPLVFTIEVTPPIWKSSLAYVLYIAILLGLLYMLFRFYKRKLNKRHELQMRTLNEEKEREKLQEKIKFFTTITHEIRTPLTLMMGSVERLAKDKRGEHNPNLQRLQSNSNRLLNLVNQLLDFRKIEAEQLYSNFTDIDIIPLVKNLCDDFEDLAQKRNLRFSFNSQMSQCKIVGDQDSVYKIFNNILANAIKFASTYVTVTIEKMVKDSQTYMVVHTDNDGPLIPAEKQKEIFKPFVQHYDSQTSTTIKGSGLGLPIVKSLAEIHGGSFYYDSSCKDHNSFVLEIPMLITSEADDAGTLDSGDGHNGNSGRLPDDENTENPQENLPPILIVDDEDELRSFVAEELSADYHVIEARNGVEALECLRNNHVALVITDLMMPVMDGIQLCKEIRADIRISHTPIVVLTAKTSLNDHIEVLQANADAYIEKPFNTQHLHAQISNLIKNRELLQNLYIHSPYSLMIGSITTNKTDDDFISKMDAFISTHSRPNSEKTPLTVETLADHMAMSAATLYRKVKSVTSISPKEYIQLHRLKEAARMLKEKNTTIKHVSETLGFSSVSHFTQCFMKQFGITPSKFMKGE